MKKMPIILTTLFVSSISFAFDFSSVLKQVDTLKSENTKTSDSLVTKKDNLSNSTITSGLKEALRAGIDYGIKELGKDGGYINNPSVKIPLPENLKKAETLIRKAGGKKLADDLINSMNTAATKAAPKTANLFIDAINNMNMNDVQKILSGNNTAATEYFKSNTTESLKKIISPIIEKSMQDNQVYSYYDTVNNFYKSNIEGLLENNSIVSMAKNFGANEYLPKSSNESLNDYITKKAIDGLYTMVAKKESEIRQNPMAQTTSLLKQVFGN